jgi:hypothetical protein
VDGDRDVLLCGSELGADLVMKQMVKFGMECRRVSYDRDDSAGQMALSSKSCRIQASLT